MGASNFETIFVGKAKDHRGAYKKACEESIDYYGHQDGYNGTISTTSGVRLTVDAPRYGTKAFNKFLDKIWDRTQKWGSCEAIEIKGKALADLKNRNPELKGKKGVKAFIFVGWAAE